MNSIHYIRKNYLTIEQLSKLTNCDEDKILLLVDNQCMPGHSFVIQQNNTISTSMNTLHIPFHSAR